MSKGISRCRNDEALIPEQIVFDLLLPDLLKEGALYKVTGEGIVRKAVYGREEISMRHDTYPAAYLAEILNSAKTVAILGASSDNRRPSYWIGGFLLGKGYRVFPINPKYAGQTILGQPVYARLADVPVAIDIVDVFRRPDQFGMVVEETLKLPELPSAIWGQLGVRDDKAARRAEAAGIKVVMNRGLVTEYPLVYELQHTRLPRSAA